MLASRQKVIETFRQIKDAAFDTVAPEKEREELTAEVNLIAGKIQDGIYQNAHVALNQTDYEKTYETLSARYEMSKARFDEVIAAIHDKASCCQQIKYYLEFLEKQKEPLEKYDVRFWHGMVDHITVYAKDNIHFTMKDGMESRHKLKQHYPSESSTLRGSYFISGCEDAFSTSFLQHFLYFSPLPQRHLSLDWTFL